MAKPDPGEPIVAACEPGAAICFLGSTTHGAGANITNEVRRGVVIGYSLGWLDRKSVVQGNSVSVRVDPGGRRIINKQKTHLRTRLQQHVINQHKTQSQKK